MKAPVRTPDCQSAFPLLSVNTTVSGPSALISVTESRSDFAADLDSPPVWYFIDATTSSDETALPLWKVAPLRSLMIQVAVPFDGSKLSARSGWILPFASTSVRLFDIAPQKAVWVKV